MFKEAFDKARLKIKMEDDYLKQRRIEAEVNLGLTAKYNPIADQIRGKKVSIPISDGPTTKAPVIKRQDTF